MMKHTKFFSGFKLCTILLSFVLALVVPFSANASAVQKYVYDKANLFTDEQEASLQSSVETLVNTTKMDYVILTIDDADGKTAQEYADDFYDYNGFNENGALLLIDMDNRDVHISTSGAAIRFYTDSRIESMLDSIFVYMPNEDYASAANAFLNEAERYFEKGIPDNQYSYDVATGKVSRYRTISGFEILIAIGIAAAVGGITCLIICSAYKMKGGKAAYSLQDNCSINLEIERDLLINKFVTTRRIDTNNGRGSGGSGSGSSTHTSSSGRSHGGGSRGF